MGSAKRLKNEKSCLVSKVLVCKLVLFSGIINWDVPHFLWYYRIVQEPKVDSVNLQAFFFSFWRRENTSGLRNVAGEIFPMKQWLQHSIIQFCHWPVKVWVIKYSNHCLPLFTSSCLHERLKEISATSLRFFLPRAGLIKMVGGWSTGSPAEHGKWLESGDGVPELQLDREVEGGQFFGKTTTFWHFWLSLWGVLSSTSRQVFLLNLEAIKMGMHFSVCFWMVNFVVVVVVGCENS